MEFNSAHYFPKQEYILELLRRFQPRSILDVGCGEGRLLQSLINCDDRIPLSRIVGLDVSLPALKAAAKSIELGGWGNKTNDRWRNLDVFLVNGIPFSGSELILIGSYRFITEELGGFDCVISCNVIDNFFTGPDADDIMSQYWTSHLGTLKPGFLIVLTANRDHPGNANDQLGLARRDFERMYLLF